MMNKELVVENDPYSPISESFRALRTNLQFMNASDEEKQVILITSTSPSEGKSWIAANVAITFAQAGKKTCLIDLDLRKSKIFTMFNVPPTPGVSNYLTGVNVAKDERDIVRFMYGTQVPNLHVIPAGNIPPNPSELLVSEKMKKMIDELKEIVDIIILDGTPCNLVTDSVIVSRIADQTILVSEYNATKTEDLRETKKAIENAGGRVTGVILNKMPVSKKAYYNKYYYGNYGINAENDKKQLRQYKSYQKILPRLRKLLGDMKEKIKKNRKDRFND